SAPNPTPIRPPPWNLLLRSATPTTSPPSCRKYAVWETFSIFAAPTASGRNRSLSKQFQQRRDQIRLSHRFGQDQLGCGGIGAFRQVGSPAGEQHPANGGIVRLHSRQQFRSGHPYHAMIAEKQITLRGMVLQPLEGFFGISGKRYRRPTRLQIPRQS